MHLLFIFYSAKPVWPAGY